MAGHKNCISSNAISIALSIAPLLPAAVVETFADGDVWTDEALQTADGVKTPDGEMLVWGQNAIIKRTLTLAPSSVIRKAIELALLSQQRRGEVVAEPYVVTAIVRNINSGAFDTYTAGYIESGEIGMSVGQNRLNNRAFTFCFGEMVPSVL